MNTPQSRPEPPSPPQPSPLRIHTMQQDLAAASPPSRFDMRHRRPLPKSQRMEDLRHQPKDEPLRLPLPANKLLAPSPASRSSLNSPIFLWIAGLILALILLMILIAIFLTV